MIPTTKPMSKASALHTRWTVHAIIEENSLSPPFTACAHAHNCYWGWLILLMIDLLPTQTARTITCRSDSGSKYEKKKLWVIKININGFLMTLYVRKGKIPRVIRKCILGRMDSSSRYNSLLESSHAKPLPAVDSG